MPSDIDLDAVANEAVLEDEKWLEPPRPEDGSPIMVEMHLYTNKIKNLKSGKGTCDVDVGVGFQWHDPRFIGWKGPLPGTLWGPELNCWNGEGDSKPLQMSFTLADAEKGTLVRNDRYVTTVNSSRHETVRFFPFDRFDITVKLSTACNWRSNNGEHSGHQSDDLVFKIVPCSAEAREVMKFWAYDGKLDEWVMDGISQSFNLHTVPNSHGSNDFVQELFLFYHMNREWGYYVFKILCPMWLLVLLCCGCYVMPIEDTGDRLNFLMTGFLTAFSLRFVISSEVPRTDFMTVVDKLILAAMWTILSCAVIVWVLATDQLSEVDRDDLNLGAAIFFAGGYTAFFWTLIIWWYFISKKSLTLLEKKPEFVAMKDVDIHLA